MRDFLVDYFPPILIKKLVPLVRNLKLKDVSIESYQNLDLVNSIIHKNLQLRQSVPYLNLDTMSFRTISAIGMAAKKGSDLTVLDFGGGAGHHQFLAKYIFENINFDWTVVETETMSRVASEEIKDEGLKFVPSLKSLTKNSSYDLIFSNSAIQYTLDPLTTLRELLSLEFENFFITRVPLNLGNSHVTYLQESLLSQNGPGPAPRGIQDKLVKYELNIVSKESFELELNGALKNWTSVDEGSWDPGRFGDQVKTYSYFGSAKNPIYLG
jgi:putative methyltransferase (TIGR04325 family)